MFWQKPFPFTDQMKPKKNRKIIIMTIIFGTFFSEHSGPGLHLVSGRHLVTSYDSSCLLCLPAHSTHLRKGIQKNCNFSMTFTIKRRTPPPFMELLVTHFFTPTFFFCNWILHTWNGFYTWLMALETPSPSLDGKSHAKWPFFGSHPYHMGPEGVLNWKKNTHLFCWCQIVTNCATIPKM